MCGIAGILIRGNKGIDTDWLGRVSRELYHRGPDDEGFLGWTPSNGSVVTREPSQIEGVNLAMVHRRLSILDLSEAGWQPMQSEDHRYSILFNGEIYNYIELRCELQNLGHAFYSHSDTEVLLKAYIQWGEKSLSRLLGMFAFVVLDLQRGTLFLARDFFGIKPLYYYMSDESFGFASETKTLLLFPEVSRKVNTGRLFPYLRFGLTDFGNETLWRDIYQLPAAHYLEVPLQFNKHPEPVRYWRVPSYAPLDIGYNEAAHCLREILTDSIRKHLRSDVQVGSCLSGGLDSSAIVMMMRDLLGSTGEIHTLSHIASDQVLNEEKWIDIIVGSANTASHRVIPSEVDLIDSLEDMVKTQGEPFGSTSIFAQYKVFELAGQQGLKVMLDGQGADEMLGGYWNFLGARIASLLAQWKIFQACTLLIRGRRFPGIDAINLASMAFGMLVPENIQECGRKILGRELLPAWLNLEWFGKHCPDMSLPWKYNGPHYLRSQLLDALSAITLPMLLRYEDRNSMRFSIESRVPFLTPQIVEFVLSLPEDFIIDQNGVRKSVFRKAMRGLVPDAILDRQDKIGFAAPEEKWLVALKPWIENLLSSEAAHSIPALNIKETKSSFERVLSGLQRDRSFTWRWVNLIEWTRLFNAEYEN
ncbi:MAG TPA: asparagine synthase (glutamine-hydrolyzing) [Syntrophorhabdus sp.]|nr:asparagine synthase (glutamine-hydrolyzing) [Syntrophorhabdus sp.]